LYEIRSEVVSTFIDDPDIALPRFQRNVTWNAKKNFELALSVFGEFPLGTVVVKLEDDEALAGVKYLLDGRQRYTALASMTNPESLYFWAKSALGLKGTDGTAEIRNKFKDYLDEYFGRDDVADLDDAASASGDSVAHDSGSDDSDDSEEGAESDEIDEIDALATNSNDAVPSGTPGTDAGAVGAEDAPYSATPVADRHRLLLRVIELVHSTRKIAGLEGHYRTGFNQWFDLHSEAAGLPYVLPIPGSNRVYVDTDELLRWIANQKDRARKAKVKLNEDQEFLLTRIQAEARTVPSTAKLQERLSDSWDKISERLMMLDEVSTVLGRAKLGYLEVRGTSPREDQKIFHIINSAGSPLTAEEVLSARPTWNVPVTAPGADVIEAQARLYDEWDIERPEEVVRWDIPATLMSRVDLPLVFGDLAKRGEEVTKNRLSIGFRLMAGHHLGKLTKDDVATLATPGVTTLRTVAWGGSELTELLHKVHSRLEGEFLFDQWRTWRASLLDSTSRAVAMNFMLLTLEDWISNGKPDSTSSAAYKNWRRNAFCLFDRSIFEYAGQRWRGSSDSTIAENLNNARTTRTVFDPVPSGEWRALLLEAIDQGTLNGRSYTKEVARAAKALLRYNYTVRGKSGPFPVNEGVEFDHIIPEAQFRATNSAAVSPECHNIANLTPLPATLNNWKSNKRLADLGTDAASTQKKAKLSAYIDVPVADFPSVSERAQFSTLRETRRTALVDDFLTDRDGVISV
jgi:hypothetical protein